MALILRFELRTKPSRGFIISNFTIRALVAMSGVEPPYSPYEDAVLPLDDTAIGNNYIRQIKNVKRKLKLLPTKEIKATCGGS